MIRSKDILQIGEHVDGIVLTELVSEQVGEKRINHHDTHYRFAIETEEGVRIMLEPLDFQILWRVAQGETLSFEDLADLRTYPRDSVGYHSGCSIEKKLKPTGILITDKDSCTYKLAPMQEYLLHTENL